MRIVPLLAFVLALCIEGTALAGDEGLLRAAQRGDLAEVRKRLNASADLNDYEGGYSPLMCAASNGHTEIVRLLIARGANLEHRDHNTDTALLWAAQRGPLEIVRILLDAGAEVDRATGLGVTPLMRAARSGRKEVVTLLLERGADVNAQGGIREETPLISVVPYGEGEIVRLLVAAEANLDLRDHEGCTALWRAAFHGYVSIVAHLLEHDADARQADGKGVSPFAAALGNGHVEVGRLLLEHVGDLDQALRACCPAGCFELARPLVERGANPNAPDDHNGRFPLDLAAEGGSRALVELLLASGANVAKSGARALHAAAGAGHAGVLRSLLDHDVVPTVTGKDGITALMRAAGGGHVPAVMALLARGAQPSAKDAQGRDAAAHMDAQQKALRARILHEQRKPGFSCELRDLVVRLERLCPHHAEIRALLKAAAWE